MIITVVYIFFDRIYWITRNKHDKVCGTTKLEVNCIYLCITNFIYTDFHIRTVLFVKKHCSVVWQLYAVIRKLFIDSTLKQSLINLGTHTKVDFFFRCSYVRGVMLFIIKYCILRYHSRGGLFWNFETFFQNSFVVF